MGVYSVFVSLLTQLYSPSNVCVCVERRHTLCAYIKLRLHHTHHSCSVFTAYWCRSVIKLTFYHHLTPSWLWLVWTNSPVFIPPRYTDHAAVMQSAQRYSTSSAGTPHIQSIMDTRHVREYQDSYTISKALTILKWRMITTLNRKLLENQRVQNCFASYEVHIGHFFYNLNASLLSVLEICLYSDLIFYWTDKLTN